MEAKARDIPEYVAKSRILREVYSELPEEVRKELERGIVERGIAAVARVHVIVDDVAVNVYLLHYEVADDGAEWLTVVSGSDAADFRTVEGEILFNGEMYLPRDYAAAVELAKRILMDIAELRSSDWRVGRKAEEYIEKFRELLGEPL